MLRHDSICVFLVVFVVVVVVVVVLFVVVACSEKEGFGMCCGAGLFAKVSVPEVSIVAATQSNSVSETFS